MDKTRETWIDFVKIYACILVVLGHFFASMIDADIILTSTQFKWFNQTIYYFHVPLFFICSGFLYQNYHCVRSFSQWRINVLKKLLDLGIPYFVFSIATYLLKFAFSGFVNKKVDDFLPTLFLHPLSPYWYLYALLIIFFVTFTISNKKEAMLFLVIALIMKIVSFFIDVDIVLIKYLLENEIWFVIGMLFSVYDIPKILKKINFPICCIIGCLFIALTVVVYLLNYDYKAIDFLMGVLGCLSTLMFFIKVDERLSKVKWILNFIKYSLPIFLMHTIFAAGFRSILVKIGVFNPFIHIAVGLTVSFVGPIIAAIVMSRLSFLEFFLYPNKVLKSFKNRRKNV